ncbi:hypothetical protein [Saccharomonospora viridis]|uniref:hypothetical protein n=1 Tax=Saccharomonospora viridis TaxID=1852 RepID=UPI002409C712|nr:hypothetical protein [Saccharomonospora viridis]
MTTVRDLALLDRMSRAARALGIITAEFRVCQVYGEDLNRHIAGNRGESALAG